MGAALVGEHDGPSAAGMVHSVYARTPGSYTPRQNAEEMAASLATGWDGAGRLHWLRSLTGI